MNISTSALPILIFLVLAFVLWITRRASVTRAVSPPESRRVYLFVALLIAWTAGATILGIRGTHIALMETIPLLWQSAVPVVLFAAFFAVSRHFRNALTGLAESTPFSSLVFVQAIRLGAIGSIFKVARGQITSTFPLWVGIPDFLYGASAILVGVLVIRKSIGSRALAVWGLLGAAIILVPTFGWTNYWMNEPGYDFIFAFPMVLAPAVVVPVFVFLDLLLAWKALRAASSPRRSKGTVRCPG